LEGRGQTNRGYEGYYGWWAFSGTAATLVRRGIPAVVAMQYQITDEAAIEFSRAFYEALADGWPVDAAVTDARVAVSMDSMLEWGTPVLYMRSPDGRLFDISTEAPSLEPTQEEPKEVSPTTEETKAENVALVQSGTREFHEFYAATVSEAVEKASATYGLSAKDLYYEVMDTGSEGFWGIGARDARIVVEMPETARLGTEEELVTEELDATDAAKEKAAQLGIDLSRVEGSGYEGRITVKDVVAAANKDQPPYRF
jgi:pyruvate/2-oxoglutarate dehydrogenase complex dihydrolipoamide acyltransferase (E2) component